MIRWVPFLWAFAQVLIVIISFVALKANTDLQILLNPHFDLIIPIVIISVVYIRMSFHLFSYNSFQSLPVNGKNAQMVPAIIINTDTPKITPCTPSLALLRLSGGVRMR